MDDTIELGLEPLHGLLFGDSLASSNTGRSMLTARDTVAWPLQHNEEIHTENTDVGIVLQT
jgi:hypothetical protein